MLIELRDRIALWLLKTSEKSARYILDNADRNDPSHEENIAEARKAIDEVAAQLRARDEWLKKRIADHD
jgi:hypothetical protein